MIYWLKQLEDQKRIPCLPVFVDSPMAARALQFYAQPRRRTRSGHASRGTARLRVLTRRMTTVASPQQSKELVASRQPAIVIASSGMATGGRVLYHLQATLPTPRNTVLFVGFQAAGTSGRALLDGARSVRIKGRDVARRRHDRSHRLDVGSRGQPAKSCAGCRASPPRRMTYLVHGEPIALSALKTRIDREKGWPVRVAEYQKRVEV